MERARVIRLGKRVLLGAAAGAGVVTGAGCDIPSGAAVNTPTPKVIQCETNTSSAVAQAAQSQELPDEARIAARYLAAGGIQVSTDRRSGSLVSYMVMDAPQPPTVQPTPHPTCVGEGTPVVTETPRYVSDANYAAYLWLHQKTLTGQQKTDFENMIQNDPIASSTGKGIYESFESGSGDQGEMTTPHVGILLGTKDLRVMPSSTSSTGDTLAGTIYFGFLDANGNAKVIKFDAFYSFGIESPSGYWFHTAGPNASALPPKSSDRMKEITALQDKEVVLGVDYPVDPANDHPQYYGQLYPNTRALGKYWDGKGRQPAYVLGSNATQEQIQNAPVAYALAPYFSAAQ